MNCRPQNKRLLFFAPTCALLPRKQTAVSYQRSKIRGGRVGFGPLRAVRRNAYNYEGAPPRQGFIHRRSWLGSSRRLRNYGLIDALTYRSGHVPKASSLARPLRER